MQSSSWNVKDNMSFLQIRKEKFYELYQSELTSY